LIEIKTTKACLVWILIHTVSSIWYVLRQHDIDKIYASRDEIEIGRVLT